MNTDELSEHMVRFTGTYGLIDLKAMAMDLKLDLGEIIIDISTSSIPGYLGKVYMANGTEYTVFLGPDPKYFGPIDHLAQNLREFVEIMKSKCKFTYVPGDLGFDGWVKTRSIGKFLR